MLRLVGRAETQNELVQHPCVEERTGKNIWFPPKNKRFHSHTELLIPQHQCWKKKPSQHLTVKSRGNSIPVRPKAAIDWVVLLRGLAKNRWTTNTCPELQQRNSSFKSTGIIQGGLNCLVSRYIWDSNAHRHLFPLLSPHTQLAGVHHTHWLG